MTHKLSFVQDSVTLFIYRKRRPNPLNNSMSSYDLWLKYFAPFDSPPNVNSFKSLLSSVDDNLIKSFFIYLIQAFKHRMQCCDDW